MNRATHTEGCDTAIRRREKGVCSWKMRYSFGMEGGTRYGGGEGWCVSGVMSGFNESRGLVPGQGTDESGGRRGQGLRRAYVGYMV